MKTGTYGRKNVSMTRNNWKGEGKPGAEESRAAGMLLKKEHPKKMLQGFQNNGDRTDGGGAQGENA